MAMARDGLLPSFFSDINECTLVPVKSTITTGVFAAALAFFMDVSQLAGMVIGLVYELEMSNGRLLLYKNRIIDKWFFFFFFLGVQVSVGTLLAFTTVAVSVLILRYVPPDVVPLPSSLQKSIDSMSSRCSGNIQEINDNNLKDLAGSFGSKGDALLRNPLIEKGVVAQGNNTLHAL